MAEKKAFSRDIAQLSSFSLVAMLKKFKWVRIHFLKFLLENKIR